MALSGTLKDFALSDIFQLIGMQRKTGLLTLESDRETVSVIFEQGMVVHSDSTIRRLDDLLGSVLVRQGKLRKEHLEEVACEAESLDATARLHSHEPGLHRSGCAEDGPFRASSADRLSRVSMEIGATTISIRQRTRTTTARMYPRSARTTS